MTATLVQEIVTPNHLGFASNLTNVNGTLFFTVDTGSMSQLWKTDGTATGTVDVRDFQGSGLGLGPTNLTNDNGSLFFLVDNSALWKSDGTAAGTVLVKEAQSFTHGWYNLTAVNDALFFAGLDSAGVNRLWKSDGTPGGTVPVPTQPANPHNVFTELTSANGTLYFIGSDLTGDLDLWKSNVTAADTVLVKALNLLTAPGGAVVDNLVATPGGVFFITQDLVNPAELWKSDGTAAGTVMLQAFGAPPIVPGSLTVVGSTAYFFHDDRGVTNLWKSDGTEAGTEAVQAVSTEMYTGISPVVNVNGTLFFEVSGRGQEQLWKSDGTAEGTLQVPLPAAGGRVGNLMSVNSTLFFTAYDAAGGLEFWQGDGTAADTVMVKDIGPITGVPQLANVSGVIYLTVNDGHGIQIWKDDLSTGPTAVAGGPYTITLGAAVTLNGLASTGIGALSYTWSVNGHTVQGGAGQDVLSPSALASYGITAPGSYLVTLTVRDGSGSSTSAASLIVLSPLLNVTGLSGTATEGTAFSGTLARFAEPAGAQPLGTYAVQIDWGDGTVSSTGTVVATMQGLVVTGGHSYAEAGTYTVTMTIAKGGGSPKSVTTTMRVADAPLWAGRQFLRVTEGQAFTGTVATSTDSNPLGRAGDFTATIQWGDGTTSTGTMTQTGPGRFAVQGGHAYAAAGKYTVTVAVADKGGRTSTAMSTVQVDDAALRALPQQMLGASLSAGGIPSILAGFTDANPLATAGQFTAKIDWGDGTSSAGTVAHAKNQPFFVVTGGNHKYAKSGRYKVTTTIHDTGGSGLSIVQTLQVFVSSAHPASGERRGVSPT
jgi:ELWxxDGT repeat protein